MSNIDKLIERVQGGVNPQDLLEQEDPARSGRKLAQDLAVGLNDFRRSAKRLNQLGVVRALERIRDVAQVAAEELDHDSSFAEDPDEYLQQYTDAFGQNFMRSLTR